MHHSETVLYLLNKGMHHAFSSDDHVFLLGEDILDPYGGAFKVVQGLSSKFPGRVITTPISEAGITGIAAGMALRGLRPIVEIMFGDFITLIADQLINHIAKFRWMYNDQVRVPIVIRVPMGGRRGYGPTHSQTLEKLYLGVPGLSIFAINNFIDPGSILSNIILKTDDPVLFIENKLLYPKQVLDLSKMGEYDHVKNFSSSSQNREITRSSPTLTFTIRNAPRSFLTLCAYGYMAELAFQAMLILAYEHEIFSELVVPTQLIPFDDSPLISSIERTGRLLVIEEGNITLGWGAEIVARMSEVAISFIKSVSRLAAKDHPIPASRPLEEATLPGVDEICNASIEIVEKGEHK